MDRLTKREIEELRKRLQGHYWPDKNNRHQMIDALCDLALQSLSQEAVRDEADIGLFAAGRMLGFIMGLEEAAKVCDKHADDWLPHHIPEKGTSKNPIYWQQRHEAAERCAELIRALKREPNAAEPVQRKEPEVMVANLDGAPAAPDVESMVKKLQFWAEKWKGLPVVPLLEEAAALLAKLGQGAPLSTDYIQTVPDKCDRIIWRGRYYHLPLAPGASDE